MTETELKKKDVIGKWCLEKPLGTGGQGQVWRVRYVDDVHSAPGALKICSDHSEKARARFTRERDLLLAQKHPGIVRVRDSGDHRGVPYFVMELATTTLGHISIADSTGTRLILESRELLLRFVHQACEALAHLHENGVLHRDLKPSNVLLMLDPPEPMRAVVADLGIAVNSADQGKLTATHEMIGTPAFRAPESFSGPPS
jgi:eukaryotic-like serine/threonine-protein kinase